LEPRLAVAELALDREPALDQQLERPVHGGVADLGRAPAHARQQLVDRDVVPCLEEVIDDDLALRRGVEPLGREVLAPALLELLRFARPKVLALPTRHRFQICPNYRDPSRLGGTTSFHPRAITRRMADPAEMGFDAV